MIIARRQAAPGEFRLGVAFTAAMCLLLLVGSSTAANRYWVAAAPANWNNTANWSTTSGGAGGASVPGSSDFAFFNAVRVGNCAINTTADVAGFSVNGYTGTITQNAGNQVTVGAGGYSQTSGTFSGGNSNINLYGSFSLSGGTFTATNANIYANGNWTVSGGTFNANSGTVVFGTSGASFTITGSHTLNNVTCSGAGTKTLAGTLSVVGDLNVSGGTFDMGSFTANRTTAGGTLTVSSGQTLIIGGTNTVPSNYSTHAIGATSTIHYSGTDQIVAVLNSAQNYGHLTLSGSGTKTLAGAVGVAENLTVTAGTFVMGSFTANRTVPGGTLTVSNGAALSIGGTNTIPSNYSTHALGATSTIDYSGTDQTVAVLNSSQDYGHLTLSGSGTKTLAGTEVVRRDLTISAVTFGLGSFTINRSAAGGTLTVSNGATLSIGGTNTIPSNYSTHAIGATSIINYSGTNQSVIVLNSAQNYGHLTISGSGTKTLGGGITVRGTLSISGGSLAVAGFTLTANGNVSNGTTHTGTGRILLTGGSGAHNLSGGGSYTNLEMNDANGATLSSNVTVNGTLTLTGGNITSGAYRLSISSSGSVSRTSGHIIGDLQKYIATGAPTTTFQIGDASNYTPVDVSFSGVSTGGDLIARTTSWDHADISSANISPARSVNRFWTLSNSGILFTSYSATFNFVSGDVDPGTNTNAIIVGNCSGSAWSYPTVGTKTSTSTQATGLTAFGDFQLGEAPNLSVSVSNATFTFGISTLNSWVTPQTSVITNDGNVAESFVGRISQFTDGSNNWGISTGPNGSDIVRAQWSTTSGSGPWVDISAYNTDFTVATNVAVGNSVTFWLRLQTPTGTSSYSEHSSVLTATAQQY